MDLPFVLAALEELEQATEHIDDEREGHGALFVEEVRVRVQRAAAFPRSGVRIQGAPPALDARRFGLKRFPYSVVVGLVSERRTVLAVAHMRREPAYWFDRGR